MHIQASADDHVFAVAGTLVTARQLAEAHQDQAVAATPSAATPWLILTPRERHQATVNAGNYLHALTTLTPHVELVWPEGNTHP